jgi:hypothetical protein
MVTLKYLGTNKKNQNNIHEKLIVDQMRGNPGRPYVYFCDLFNGAVSISDYVP